MDKKFIIRWNNEHPLDRRYREKYKIGFNSPQHREINQLDIYLEYLEDQAYIEFEENLILREEAQKAFENGEWIKAPSKEEIDKQTQDLFDKIDISSLNKDSKIQFK